MNALYIWKPYSSACIRILYIRRMTTQNIIHNNIQLHDNSKKRIEQKQSTVSKQPAMKANESKSKHVASMCDDWKEYAKDIREQNRLS